MLDLCATYLLVRDIEKSIKFYSQLLEMKPTSNILDRWAQFDIEGCSLALFNQMYDYQAIAGGAESGEALQQALFESAQQTQDGFR
jgi:lactoylglutathione lyase